MSSDFVFINPNKIPPRRSVKTPVPGRLKIKEIGDGNSEVPEFNLLAGVLPPADLAVQVSGDPLSQAIFNPESKKINRPIGFLAAKTALSEKKPKLDLKKALLAELEKIEDKDQRLVKKINQLEIPSRAVPIHLVSSFQFDEESEDENTDLKIKIAPQGDFYQNFESDTPAAGPVLSHNQADSYRAENDWFQVARAGPSRILELKKYAESKTESGSQILKTSPVSPPSSSSLKTFLVSLAILILPLTVAGSFFFWDGGNVVKTAWGNINNKLLSSASFTLVNAEDSDIFPGLVKLNSQIKSFGLTGEVSQNIADFLQKNADFSWLNIFKKKTAAGNFLISDLESLNQAKGALQALSAGNKNLAGLSSNFSNYVSLFSFWNSFFSAGKKYLMVVLDPNQTWPGGGAPKNYVLINIGPNGLEPISSGKFSSLDAALNLKIVPPDPVKLVSTAWLPSQSFWFLDFEESAKTLISFFENTTAGQVDGVVAVSRDFLQGLSFKESLILDTNSPSWFYGLSDALSRKPAGRWVSLANILAEGLASHQIQFYFKDAALENFVEGSNWSSQTSGSYNSGNFIGFGEVNLKGEALKFDLAEYRAQIFEDGSVVVDFNLMLKKNSDADSQNYLKIYLPLGSQVLKADGFSPQEEIPEFNYTGQGFSMDRRIKKNQNSQIENVDLFEEGESAVVGGWFNLKNSGRNAINLEYISPIKISRQDNAGSYNLKIIRPAQKEDMPFRYVVVPQAGVEIKSLEPDGFVSENMGEYQSSLSRDLNPSASFLFK